MLFSKKYLELVEVSKSGDGARRLIDEDEIVVGTSSNSAHLPLFGRGLLSEHLIVRRKGAKVSVEDISNGRASHRKVKAKEFIAFEGEINLSVGDFLSLGENTYIEVRTSKTPIPKEKSTGGWLSELTSGTNAMIVSIPVYGAVLWYLLAPVTEPALPAALSQRTIQALAESARDCAKAQISSTVKPPVDLGSRVDASWRAIVSKSTDPELRQEASDHLVSALTVEIARAERLMHWHSWEDAIVAFESIREMAPFAPSVVSNGNVDECRLASYVAERRADASAALARKEEG